MDFGEWELLHINEWWEVRMERKEGKTSFSVFTHSLNSTTLTPMNKITLPHGLRHIFHTTQDSFTSCPTELPMLHTEQLQLLSLAQPPYNPCPNDEAKRGILHPYSFTLPT